MPEFLSLHGQARRLAQACKRRASEGAGARASIVVHGARQNNLKNLDLEIPLHELVVVTGVSGSGKSSLVFDTLYAEGQRRYVETFSPYARQFLDRMDKPAVDRIDGIPPAIAIDQTNPVRTSRSTVGTMTELNDHLKLLFARAGHPALPELRQAGAPRQRRKHFRRCHAARGGGRPIRASTSASRSRCRRTSRKPKFASCSRRRATRASTSDIGDTLEVVQDRLRLGNAERARVMESLETALRVGRGRVNLHVVDESDPPKSVERWKYSSELHCADCDLSYRDPVPSLFSFNSPVGACETCRGFGRIIGIDYGLVIPDETKTLAGGAVKPWQTKSYKECQDDLVKFAKKRDIPLDTPWYALSDAQRKWVIEGEGKWEKKVWYGAKRFFEWLETKSYKMHVRVLLSRYRAYTPCTACGGSRLKPDALLWRIAGQNVHDLMLLPLDRARAFFDGLTLPAPLDEAADLLLAEVRARFAYLCEVGLGYLTLDRQSRTLSGGEVQRINLTTALGTSLVNTLFVLDEPSIGLHPRDMQRVTQVMHRLRDAGNSLVVVEHDPQIMLAADRLLDLGPGAGERGGEIVAFDTPEAMRANPRSLTGQYLSGAKQVAPRAPAPQARGAANRARVMVPARSAPSSSRRARAQSQEHRRGVSAAAPGVYHRRVRLGQVHAHRGCAAQGHAQGAGPAERDAGRLRSARGRGQVDDVVMIDQSSIGRTTRSNPASYVGAFDVVRELFASEGAAKARGYTPGTFSFNSGTGRCPTCSGNGFEHVEMQFLSDVYLRCPDCDGKRYRAETLEIRREGADGTRRNIADVLDMTVTEALAFFKDRLERRGAPAAAGGRGTRIREARPAGAHAVGRRGAATETRGPPGRGRGRRHALDPRQAVPVRRADHRPALRRRRQTTARLPQAAQDRPLADRHRAQPRRDPRGRLVDRPRPRGRRRRRRDRGRRHARAGRGRIRLPHRQGAARIPGSRLVDPGPDAGRSPSPRSAMQPAIPSSCTARASTTCATSTWRFRARPSP